MIGEKDQKSGNLITLLNIKDWKLDTLVSCLSEFDKIKKPIEYIGLKKPYGLMVKFKGLRELFYPGDIDIAEKILFYLKLKRTLPVNKDKILSVDLRFKNRFYLEFDKEVSTDEK